MGFRSRDIDGKGRSEVSNSPIVLRTLRPHEAVLKKKTEISLPDSQMVFTLFVMYVPFVHFTDHVAITNV